MKNIFEFVKIFYPKPTLIFTEEILLGEAVVFVANHEKNYGPSVMQLFFPVEFHPWVINQMLEKGECSSYVEETFFNERLNFPVWLSRIMGIILEPVLIRVMSSTNPIPVFRNDPQRLIGTFRESLSILEKGENILIFPENPRADNFSRHVKEFYEGFLYIAKLYFRKTGRELSFCPVSINPHQRTITVGKSVRFNSKIDFRKESERMRTHMMRQITDLYYQKWSAQAQPDQPGLAISGEIVR